MLNKHGHKTGKGKRWNKTSVETARRTYSIAGQRAAIVDPDVLTLSGAARYCHVSPKSIEKLAAHGLAKQDASFAQSKIKVSSPLRLYVGHVEANPAPVGKLVPTGCPIS